VRQGKLVIRKKPQSIVDETLVELYSDRAKPYIAETLIPAHPFAFHVRYYWNEHIDFVVLNPEIDAAWQPPVEQISIPYGLSRKSMRQKLLDVLRTCLSQQSRNSRIDLLPLLQCPTCHADQLTQSENQLSCNACGSHYSLCHGIPRLYAQSKVNQNN
jgi:uncharacterized protein YbaR (Trm112 family)